MTIEIRQADWDGFTNAMGQKGGCGGCWCMLWRLSRKEWDAGVGEDNRAAMQKIFKSGHVPGLIAWNKEEAVGWIQVDARSAFPRLATSRILKPLDDFPVWSVACFFINKKYRRQGLSLRMLEAACDFAKSRGAGIIEGYPIDTPRENYPAVYAWTGFMETFRCAGFNEVERRSDTRPIMRKRLGC